MLLRRPFQLCCADRSLWHELFLFTGFHMKSYQSNSLKDLLKICGGVVRSYIPHCAHLHPTTPWPRPTPSLTLGPQPSEVPFPHTLSSTASTGALLFPPGFSQCKLVCHLPTPPRHRCLVSRVIQSSSPSPLAYPEPSKLTATRIYPQREMRDTTNKNSVTYKHKCFIKLAVLTFFPPKHVCLMNKLKCNIKSFLKKCNHLTTGWLYFHIITNIS